MKVHTLLEKPLAQVIDDVVTPERCDALIAHIEALAPAAAPVTTARGPLMRPDIRNNDRVMFDDLALAAELFERLSPVLPHRLHDRHGEDLGTLVGLNERFRGYRYSVGHRFAPHFDGAFVRNERERSELTVLLYLNEGFSGGATAFCDYEVRVDPRRAQVLIFEHLVRHEGCVVESGVKYVLRTDAMYRVAG